jgi:hypothetical protein
VRQFPSAVAAHRAVLFLDGEQFGGRLGRRRSERQRERSSAARRRDEIRAERRQRVDGAGSQCRAQPLIELGCFEPTIDNGGTQHFDNPVAVRIGRAQHGRASGICRHPASSAEQLWLRATSNPRYNASRTTSNECSARRIDS